MLPPGIGAKSWAKTDCPHWLRWHFVSFSGEFSRLGNMEGLENTLRDLLEINVCIGWKALPILPMLALFMAAFRFSDELGAELSHRSTLARDPALQDTGMTRGSRLTGLGGSPAPGSDRGGYGGKTSWRLVTRCLPSERRWRSGCSDHG
jgi:hypothetical protein